MIKQYRKAFGLNERRNNKGKSKNYYNGPLMPKDTVIVISGKYKNTIGEIISIDRKKSMVRVENVNVRKRNNKHTVHLGPREMAIHISNVKYYDKELKISSKLKWVKNNNKKTRYGIKLNKEI